MLEDVDRARQATKQAEAAFAKEQQRRLQSEEAAAQTLEAGRQRLRETQQAAQQMERELREQLASQAVDLAKAKSEGESFLERGRYMHARLQEEKAAHDGTHLLLAQALDSQAKLNQTRLDLRSPPAKSRGRTQEVGNWSIKVSATVHARRKGCI